MKVTVYPNTLSEVQAGWTACCWEPHGCFEQDQYDELPERARAGLPERDQPGQAGSEQAAKELLDRGYGRLTSFECQNGSGREGYEWFGGTAPPHESLTAYGLLQFTDMSRVFPVDAEMLKADQEVPDRQ